MTNVSREARQTAACIFRQRPYDATSSLRPTPLPVDYSPRLAGDFLPDAQCLAGVAPGRRRSDIEWFHRHLRDWVGLRFDLSPVCRTATGRLFAALSAPALAASLASLVFACPSGVQPVRYAVYGRRGVAVLGRIRRALQFHRGGLFGLFQGGGQQHSGVLSDLSVARRLGGGGCRHDRCPRKIRCGGDRSAAVEQRKGVGRAGVVAAGGRAEQPRVRAGFPARMAGRQCVSARTGEQRPVPVLRGIPQQRAGLCAVLCRLAGSGGRRVDPERSQRAECPFCRHGRAGYPPRNRQPGLARTAKCGVGHHREPERQISGQHG